MSADGIAGDAKPRLPRGVRLKRDEGRRVWLLLGPERVINCSPTAVEILKRCDGEATVEGIVADLAATYSADPEIIGRDVRALLAELSAKRLVDL